MTTPMPPIVSRAEWQKGTRVAGHIGPLSHLHAKDTPLVLISRAALPKLLAFRER